MSTVVATDPGDWLAWVARNGGEFLELVISTRLDWLIRVADTRNELWRPRMRPRLGPGTGKPWNQSYEARDYGDLSLRGPKDVATATVNLKRSLESIVEFARRAELDEWAVRFAEARSILDLHDAPIPYYPDLLATCSGAGAHRLAAASATASLFDGAGSWSDIRGDIRKLDRYRAVTSAAHTAVIEGIAAAANERT
jgi:hypothetical protein